MNMTNVPPVTVTQEQHKWVAGYRQRQYEATGIRPTVSDVMRKALDLGLSCSYFNSTRRFSTHGRKLSGFLADPEKVETLTELANQHDVTRSAIIRAGIDQLMKNGN
jgi:hypothetical protein